MKSVAIFGGILLVTMGVSWMQLTADVVKPKEGIVLVDGAKADLKGATYKAPDLTVDYEIRSDGLGSYGWVTVTEIKKKKTPVPDKPGEFTETSETKISKFKAGSGNDKLLDSLAPLMAVRELANVPVDKIESFGLTAPDTSMRVQLGGQDRTLLLGGETYGTKDRYVKDSASSKVYVVDDEVFKSLKFASTRLPERALTDLKPEQITSVSLGQGGTSVAWNHKNKDDKAAAYWERDGAAPITDGVSAPPVDGSPAEEPSTKDSTFSNWMDLALKLKSTAYVQDGEEPAALEAGFDVTFRSEGKPEQTIHVLHAGDDWFARGDFTRGLVKLSKGPAEDCFADVDDILEGRVPPEKPKAVKPPPALTKPPSGDKASGGPPARPGGPPSMPGMPPRPPGPPPTLAPKGQ